DIAVVMKMIKKPLPSLCRPSEVNGQHSSSGLQNPSHFVSTLLASFAAEVMKHNRGQYCVELTVGKRYRFSDAILEDDLDTGLVCLSTRPGKHVRRRVNSIDCACGTHAPFRGDG